MSRRSARRTVLAALACAAAVGAAVPACKSDSPKGDLVLGTFDFTVEPADDGCHFDGGVEMASTFTGTLSVDTTKGTAYLTVDSQSHEGTLADNHLVVSAGAYRDIPAPCGCPGVVTEVVEGDLIPQGTAPSCALLPDGGQSGSPDGGRPDASSPFRADASVSYDLLCNGSIDDHYQPDAGACSPGGGCPCATGCHVRYRLQGQKQ